MSTAAILPLMDNYARPSSLSLIQDDAMYLSAAATSARRRKRAVLYVLWIRRTGWTPWVAGPDTLRRVPGRCQGRTRG
jgi:hypothetical protein